MTRGELVALIDQALERKGITPAAASIAASGNHYLIRNMTRADGRITVPNFENLQALCDVLDLEFYIGPPRRPASDAAPAHALVYGLDEFTPRQMGLLDPLPGDAMFFVQPAFGIPNRLRPRSYCLVEPEAPLLDGDLVYIEDHRGGVNIGVYKGSTDNGWPVMKAHGGMEIEWNPDHLRRIAPITWTGRTPPPFVTADTAPSPSSRDNARITARIDRLAKALDELKEEIAG